uniref:Putative oxidoreductase ykvO n=1 Tax=Lygus hesperus TaxID=30085 RepID=A0A0A9X5M8_LYGHE
MSLFQIVLCVSVMTRMSSGMPTDFLLQFVNIEIVPSLVEFFRKIEAEPDPIDVDEVSDGNLSIAIEEARREEMDQKEANNYKNFKKLYEITQQRVQETQDRNAKETIFQNPLKIFPKKEDFLKNLSGPFQEIPFMPSPTNLTNVFIFSK